MQSAGYTFHKRLQERSFDTAVQQVTAALADEGFGVLTEIDVQATLKNKINVDFRPYKILGACRPQLAYQALQVAPEIGALLPCNVVVQASGDGIDVNIASPRAMFAAVDQPQIQPVIAEAESRLRRVIDALS